MNRMHLKLRLTISFLGIPFNEKHYRQICNATYLCKTRGIHTSSATILFDNETRQAYSPFPRGSYGNLLSDVREIQEEIESGNGDSTGLVLDPTSQKRLSQLKRDIKSKGMEILLEEGGIKNG